MTPLLQNAIAPTTGKGSADADAHTLGPADVPPIEAGAAWPVIGRFPTLLAGSIPLQQVRVRDLLDLQPGRILYSAWNCSADVPLSIGPLQLVWGELDVLNGNIALRITRTA